MSMEFRFEPCEWREYFHGKTQRQTEELISQFLFYRETDRGFEILTFEELKAWFAEWEQYDDEYPYENVIEYLNDAIGTEIHLVKEVK